MTRKFKMIICALLALCLVSSLAACGGNDKSDQNNDTNSDSQSQIQGNQDNSGNVTSVDGELTPVEAEKTYVAPQVSDGYVLIREEPDSGRHTIYWYNEDGRLAEHDLTSLEDCSAIEAHFVYEYQDNPDGTCFVTSTVQEDFPYGYYEYIYSTDWQMLSMARYFGIGYETPDRTEEYAYDAAGRLIKTTYMNGSYDTLEYDENGNLVRESSCAEDGTEVSWSEYTLDENGLISHEHFLKLGSVGDNDWEWTCLWDDAGRLTKLEARDEHNATRFSQLYTYNESGDLVELNDKHEKVTYYYAPLSEAILP